MTAGLITAVVQDDDSDEILMVAHMNAESLAKTLQTGETWFWSRSRRELWHKGDLGRPLSESSICAWIATATRCWCGSIRTDRPVTQANARASSAARRKSKRRSPKSL